MMNIGLCLSDPHPQIFGDGSGHRTAAAIHFAGHYRLIDFMLSNMVNSGVYTVAMVLGRQYQTLLTHIGSGRDWDLARSSGGVLFFPPYPGGESPFYGMRDEPLQRALTFIGEAKTEHVLVTECSTVYNIDFREALERHRATGADVTALYKRNTLLEIDQPYAVAYGFAKNGRLNDVSFAPPPGEVMNLSIGAFIVKKTVLLRLLSGERACDGMRFACEVLAGSLRSVKIMGWEFEGYVARVCTPETFFHYNMDMLDPEKRQPLFNTGGRRINTNSRDVLPTMYGKGAKIRNSIVPDGCEIEGTVENCVLFGNVRVGEGAVVRNSILQNNTVVSANASLDWIVTDRNVIVNENRNLLGYKTHPVYIARDKTV